MKICGHRIELGEIRAVRMEQSDVDAAAVVVSGADVATRRIDAYVVLGLGTTAAPVRRAVQGLLPEYMMPSTVTALPALPMTVNGKVDTGRLPTQRRGRTGAGDGGRPSDQADHRCVARGARRGHRRRRELLRCGRELAPRHPALRCDARCWLQRCRRAGRVRPPEPRSSATLRCWGSGSRARTSYDERRSDGRTSAAFWRSTWTRASRGHSPPGPVFAGTAGRLVREDRHQPRSDLRFLGQIQHPSGRRSDPCRAHLMRGGEADPARRFADPDVLSPSEGRARLQNG